MRVLACAIAAVCALSAIETAAGQESVVLLRAGRPDLTVGGSVAGFTTKHYAFETGAGQRFEISVVSPSSFVCFEVIAPDGAMLYRGSTAASERRSFTGTAPYGGAYMVSVFFRRDEAMRRSSAPFTLRLSTHEEGGAAAASLGDRIAGQPNLD